MHDLFRLTSSFVFSFFSLLSRFLPLRLHTYFIVGVSFESWNGDNRKSMEMSYTRYSINTLWAITGQSASIGSWPSENWN